MTNHLSDSLFWDCDPALVDPEAHASFLVGRVLERGTWEDWKSIRDYYGEARIKEICLGLRHMDKKTLSYCSGVFDVPREEFRCTKALF